MAQCASQSMMVKSVLKVLALLGCSQRPLLEGPVHCPVDCHSAMTEVRAALLLICSRTTVLKYP